MHFYFLKAAQHDDKLIRVKIEVRNVLGMSLDTTRSWNFESFILVNWKKLNSFLFTTEVLEFFLLKVMNELGPQLTA